MRLNPVEFSAATKVVVIGVGSFERRGLEPLPGPEGQAQRIAEVLAAPVACGIPKGNICCLVGKKARRSSIEEALRTAASACLPHEILIVYFAGHGLKVENDFVLCPYDMDVAEPLQQGFSGAELGEILSSSAARGVAVLLDCCVSAGFAENAPQFFRSLSGRDFRILLSSARENQSSWETLDGQGTLFSRSLLRLLEGRNAGGTQPGQLTFGDILEGIEFLIAEERTLRPDLPLQDIVFVGAYGRDPLLFVHAGTLLSGLTVATARVSREHLRRTVRSVIAAIMISVVFVLGTYVAWVDEHEYAVVAGDGIVIYRGYPNAPWFGYPIPLAQLEISSDQLVDDNPLRRGQPLVSFGSSVKDLIEADLRQEFEALRLLSDGQTGAARAIVLDILRQEDLGIDQEPRWVVNDRVLVSSMVLPDVAEAQDLPVLIDLLEVDRAEVRTNALRGIYRVDPAEALLWATNDAVRKLKFQHRDFMYGLDGTCGEPTLQYLEQLTSGPTAHQFAKTIIDTAIRLHCSLSAGTLAQLSRHLPLNDAWDIGPIANILNISEASAPFEEMRTSIDKFDRRRAAIILASMGLNGCNVDDLELATLEMVDQSLKGRLLMSSCPGARAEVNFRKRGNIELRVWVGQEELVLGITSIERSPFYAADALISMLRHHPVENVEQVLLAFALNAQELEVRASAVDVLFERKANFSAPVPLRFGNSLTLARALVRWWASADPRASSLYLVERLSDQEFFDLYQLFIYLSLEEKQLDKVRAILEAGEPLTERAVAVLAMHGNPTEVADLLLDWRLSVSSQALAFVALNPRLGEIVVAIETKNPRLAATCRGLMAAQAKLADELESVPPEYRQIRARYLLEGRAKEINTARQLLTPGLSLWLRRESGLGGDLGF